MAGEEEWLSEERGKGEELSSGSVTLKSSRIMIDCIYDLS